MSTKPRELPEFVDDLVRIGAAELVATAGLGAEQARTVMARIADGIVTHYARSTMYVPAAFGTRNQEIWRKYGEPGPAGPGGQLGASPYTRQRVVELAAEYGLTERQIYSILTVMRARELATMQPTLPGFEPLR